MLRLGLLLVLGLLVLSLLARARLSKLGSSALCAFRASGGGEPARNRHSCCHGSGG